jgi:hypothetical protein
MLPPDKLATGRGVRNQQPFVAQHEMESSPGFRLPKLYAM